MSDLIIGVLFFLFIAIIVFLAWNRGRPRSR
jgi:hypothetical protein